MILPLIWLPKGYLFLSEEDNFANFQNVIYRNLYSWAPPVNNGQPVTPADQSIIIPNGVFYYLLSQFNIPNDIIQKTYLYLTIFVTFVSMAYFLRLFTRNKLIIFTGVLFYYFNFYVWSTMFYSAKVSQLILMPLFFTFLYKYLETKKYLYAILNFFSLFVFQSIFTNLTVALLTFFIYFVSIAYFIIKKNINILFFIREYWLKIIMFFILTLPLFLYNAMVVFFSVISNDSFIRARQIIGPSKLYATLDLIFQFRGAWWEFINSGGVEYNPWLWFYKHPLIVTIFLFLVIVALSSFLEKNAKKIHLFWLVAYLMSILLASGASFYPPFYQWMYDNVPFFYIFREPWAKFTPLLVFSTTVLLTVSLDNKKMIQKTLTLFCLFLILIKGYPFFSDKLINNISRRWSIPLIKLPDYWNKYGEWSKINQDKKILGVPVNYFKRNWYKENLGNADHQLAKLFGYSHVIYYLPNNNFGIIMKYFVDKNNPNFYKIATIDYLLVQEDIDMRLPYYNHAVRTYSETLKDTLTDRLVQQFNNKLFLYAIKPEFKLPQIYTAKDIIRITAKNDEETILKKLAVVLSRPDYKPGTAIFINANTKINKLSESIGETPILSFNKLNPTKYKVSIKQAHKKFLLVFNESFNRYWKMYVNKNSNIFPLPDDKHVSVNGYANSWLIETDDICQQKNMCQKNPDGSYSFELVIEYWPQRLFYGAMSAIGIVVLFSCLYLLYTVKKSLS